MRRMCEPRSGQMPFSIVAALLLVLSGASIVVVWSVQNSGDQDDLTPASLKEMMDLANKHFERIEQASYSLAVDAIREHGAENESFLDLKFRETLLSYLRAEYPKSIGAFSVNAENPSINLSYLRMASSETFLEVSGPGAEPRSGTDLMVPAYFSVSGSVSVLVNCSQGHLIREFSLDKVLYIPLPFLQNRIQAFSNAVSGERAEFENTVRYMLSTLAQARVLGGYGIGSRDGPTGTGAIIAAEDVSNAIGLALILEQYRHFREVDEDNASRLASNLWDGNSSSGIVAALRNGGWLNPADLFLQMNEAEDVRTSFLLAEALYSLADILVLRWLDYLHVMDLMEFVESAGEYAEIGLSSMLDHLLGVDKLQDSALSWLTSRMESAGYSEGCYRYQNYDSPDTVVEVPEHRMLFFSRAGESFEVVLHGYHEIDFPPVDILKSERWKAFYVQFKVGTFELADALDAFVKNMATGIALNSDLPPIDLASDPWDRKDFIEALERAVVGALANRDSWIGAAIEEARSSFKILDRMGEGLLDFLGSEWQNVFDRKASVDSAITSLADSMMSEVACQTGMFDDTDIETGANRIYWEIRQSSTWSLLQRIEDEFDRRAAETLGIFRSVFGSLETRSFLGDVLSGLAAGAVRSVPGVQDMLCIFVLRFVSDLKTCSHFRSERIEIPMSSSDGFSFISEAKSEFRERMSVQCSPSGVSRGKGDGEGGAGLWQVAVKEPWQYERASDHYPNRHIAGLKNVTTSPYVSQWQVSFDGSVDVSLRAGVLNSALLGSGDSVGLSANVHFHGDFTILVTSAWPLVGVDYTPTSTLGGDIARFLEEVWAKIAGGLAFISEGVSKAFSLLRGMVSSLLSYATKGVELLASTLLAVVDGVRSFFTGIASGLIGWVGETASVLFGTVRFSLSIFGLAFTFETNVCDLGLGSVKDLLRVTFSLSGIGATVSVSARFVKLGPGDYDLISNATLSTEDWRVTAVFDPLMKVCHHLVEVKGRLHRYAFELYLPEIVSYNMVKLSLAELPGIGALLSSIPTPVPGLTGSIDAGIAVKYASPFRGSPVINEYEQNPPGGDFGREWIEIYNPTDVVVSLEGWSIETRHGTQRIETLGGTTVMPRSVQVYALSGQVLDNGGELEFPASECAVLRDEKGNRVDATPWTTDYYNDGRTWQRVHDGGDRWVFREETRGEPNSNKRPVATNVSKLRDTLVESISRSIGRTANERGSPGSLGGLAEAAVSGVLDGCIKLMSNCLVEVRFYVELAVQDATSSTGAGFTLSLVATGDLLEDGLRWVGERVRDAVERMTNPYSAVSDRSLVAVLAEDVYIRVSAFGRLGLPKALSTGIANTELRCDAVIEANVASIAGILGVDLGRWRVNFGVVVSGVLGGLIPPEFGIDSAMLVDVWVFRASVYELDSAV